MSRPLRLVVDCRCGHSDPVPIGRGGDSTWTCGGCGRRGRLENAELGRLADRLDRARRIAIAVPAAVAAVIALTAVVGGPGMLLMAPLGAGLAAVLVRQRYQHEVRKVYVAVAAQPAFPVTATPVN